MVADLLSNETVLGKTIGIVPTCITFIYGGESDGIVPMRRWKQRGGIAISLIED